jgi:hypothetical protein
LKKTGAKEVRKLLQTMAPLNGLGGVIFSAVAGGMSGRLGNRFPLFTAFRFYSSQFSTYLLQLRRTGSLL